MSLRQKFKAYWADDWHALPRICRDISLWLKGPQWARVGLWNITWDEQTQMQQMDYTRVSRKDLPPEAVHVTGKGWREYAVDNDRSGHYPQPGELTAVDLYLFAKTDAFDEDSLFTERRGLAIDSKTLMLIVGALVAIVAVWFIWNNFM